MTRCMNSQRKYAFPDAFLDFAARANKKIYPLMVDPENCPEGLLEPDQVEQELAKRLTEMLPRAMALAALQNAGYPVGDYTI